MMSGEVLAAGEGWYISVTDDHRLQLTIRGGDARMIAQECIDHIMKQMDQTIRRTWT